MHLLSSASLQRWEGQRKGRTELRRHTGCGYWITGICSGGASMLGQMQRFLFRASLPR
jgi:hypothetical protein